MGERKRRSRVLIRNKRCVIWGSKSTGINSERRHGEQFSRGCVLELEDDADVIMMSTFFLFLFLIFLIFFITFDLRLQIKSNKFLKICKNNMFVLNQL